MSMTSPASSIDGVRAAIQRLLVILLTFLAGTAPVASQDPLMLRERDGTSTLGLERIWSAAIPADIEAKWGIGFDGNVVTLADALFENGIVASEDSLYTRPLACADRGVMWVSTSGAALTLILDSTLVLCDPRVGRPATIAQLGQMPSQLGRGHGPVVPTTLAGYGAPVRLGLVDLRSATIDTIDPRAAAAATQPPDARFALGLFDVIAASDTWIAVIDSRSLRGSLYRPHAGGVAVWNAAPDGFTAAPYTSGEIERMLAEVPDSLRSMLRGRFASSGRAFSNRYLADVDEDGNVWLGVIANDPREYHLMRVSPDGRVMETRLLDGIRALSYARNRLAIWRASGEDGSEVAVYRIGHVD